MNKALYAAPYLITILTVINTVAQYKTGLRTYALVGVPCLIICLLLYLSQPAKNPLKVSSQRLLLFFLWIGLLFCGESLLGTLHKNESLAIKAIFSIAWAPLFWIFFVPLANSFDWQRFAKFQVLVGLLVAALGFVQRFYSLNLFGMVPNVKWHDHFSSHMGMYRVTSVLSSPQVYGLYCAIMAVVAASCFPKWSKKLSWGIFWVVLSVAGVTLRQQKCHCASASLCSPQSKYPFQSDCGSCSHRSALTRNVFGRHSSNCWQITNNQRIRHGTFLLIGYGTFLN